jgi:hypothetical protein
MAHESIDRTVIVVKLADSQPYTAIWRVRSNMTALIRQSGEGASTMPVFQ